MCLINDTVSQIYKNNMKCNNCPRKCNVNRIDNLGFCGLENKLKIAKACLHFGEEPVISNKNGSGTIFFSGCNLKCVYCQNFNLSHNNFGKEITVKRLAEIFKELENKGANNINLVSPTPYVHFIKEALDIYKPKIPIVYNTSGYETEEVIKSLKGYVDIFLTDLKYMDENLSKQLSCAPDYFEKTSKAIKQMIELCPEVKIKNGIMTHGVIIRHMVLPNCTQESKNVLEYISKNYSGAFVSIMSQYTPYGKVTCDKLLQKYNRKIKPLEYKSVLNYAVKLNLNGFMQELSSANTSEIPKFDLEGV